MDPLKEYQSESGQEDRSLVAAAKKDPRQFAAVYDRYLGSIYKYLFSRTGQKKLAEDLTAETFLTALERLPDFKLSGSFSPWLFTVARNKLMDYYRGNGKLSADQMALVLLQDSAASPLERVLQKELIDQLSVILETLPDGQLELLRLRFSAELKFSEIAEIQGKNEDAVKKEFYRLLKYLKSNLEVADVSQS